MMQEWCFVRSCADDGVVVMCGAGGFWRLHELGWRSCKMRLNVITRQRYLVASEALTETHNSSARSNQDNHRKGLEQIYDMSKYYIVCRS